MKLTQFHSSADHKRLKLTSPAVVAIAVCAILLIVVVWFVSTRRARPSALEQGQSDLYAAYRKERLTISRVSGFDYANLVNVPGQIDQRALARAERHLLDALAASPGSETHHALGKFYLAGKNTSKAITELNKAVDLNSKNALAENDLAAALIERSRGAGELTSALDSLSLALEHIQSALRIEPTNKVALFNRALILQLIRADQEARSAWANYVNSGAEPGWADEAQVNLQRLPRTDVVPATAAELLDNFLIAFAARDDETAWKIMSENKEMITGKFIPQQLARSYLRESSRDNSATAHHFLDALKYAGKLETTRAKDPFVSHIADYYGRTTSAQQQTLSKAHAYLAKGYDTCLQTSYKNALPSFLRAQQLFAVARDEWEVKICGYWIAYCFSQLDKLRESTSMLQGLANYSERNGYLWLLGQATCWIAANFTELSEPSRAIEAYTRALPVIDAIGDTYNKQKALSLLGDNYTDLGQPTRALDYDWQSLQLMSRRYTSPRQMWRNDLYTARALVALQRNESASVYGREMLNLAVNEIKEPGVVHFSYVHLSEINRAMRRLDEALRLASESLRVASSIADTAAARKFSAGSLRLIAHIQRQTGLLDEALGSYDKAIDAFQKMQLNLDKYDAHKGRLLCYAALGDRRNFEAELPMVLNEFERYRQKIREEQNRNTFFDNEQSVYDLAIDHAITNGQRERAFDYLERSRARSLLSALLSDSQQFAPAAYRPLGVDHVKAALPGDVQIVEYAVLNDRIVIFYFAAGSFESVTQTISSGDLKEKVLNYVQRLTSGPGSADGLRVNSTELYDILIKPVAGRLNPQKTLVLIPDKVLSFLPFAALTSSQTGRYLLSDFAVMTAPSLSVFLVCSERAGRGVKRVPEAVLSVGNPLFDRRAYPDLADLTSAAREATEVANAYERSRSLIGREATKASLLKQLHGADVLHFAGHYIPDERHPERAKLILARGDPAADQDPDLSAGELTKRKLHLRLVILSACQTTGLSYYNGEGLIGIARTFLEAGTPLVIATQWPIETESSTRLMVRFHQYRKEGASSVEALRKAQLELLADPTGVYKDPYYWAAFSTVGGYANF